MARVKPSVPSFRPDFREAAAFTDDIIYQLNANAEQVYLNAAGHAWLELPNGAANGKPWTAFVHEDDRISVQAALDAVLRTGRDQLDVEARLVSTHGKIVRSNHRMRAIADRAGNIIGLIGIGRDITPLRRVEEQLHQSQKLETIGMLAGGIAHDFNNMLAAILGYTELMLEDKNPDSPDYRALSYIQASTERAAALVRQLLVFSRRSSAEHKPVRVGALIDETLQMLERTLPKTIRIVASTSGQDDHVLGDWGRLQQALMNLCLNARDAMGQGGEIRIGVDRLRSTAIEDPLHESLRAGDFVRIRVQDTGHGISPSAIQQIWDPFFTTKPSGEGTGLGLSVVHSIVQMHHGHVEVESCVGRGTTFSLYLPAASECDLAAVRALIEPDGGTETILVVDDEPVLLDLLTDILHPKGYHVLATNTCDEALAFVETLGDRIDLVISDNMMPGMTGRELACEIRRKCPNIKILVCSGFSPTRDSELSQMDYVASYVQKPYQRRDLLTRVRAALDPRKAPESPCPDLNRDESFGERA